MIRITRKTDQITVDRIVAAIYAQPGLGKSTLAFTADSPLLLDFDAGAYRAANRGDTVQITSWQDVTQITADDVRDYRTIVIDTAGRALDLLSADIIQRNPKMGRGGALTLQGYGALKAEFIAWTKLLRSFGLDVILIAHSSEEKNGDDLIERIDVQGGSKGEVYKVADLMGRLSIQNGKRVLNFSPTDTAFGKNPASLPPLEVPDVARDGQFLAEVIRTVKDSLNALSAEQQAIVDALESWKAHIAEAEEADDYTNMVAQVAKIDERARDTAKRLLMRAAKDAGFEYDTKAKRFAAKDVA